jgi:hypothetical protein
MDAPDIFAMALGDTTLDPTLVASMVDTPQ